MPYGNHRSVTLPKDVVDEAERILEKNRERLKKIGIKKISHIFERAYYNYKDELQNSP